MVAATTIWSQVTLTGTSVLEAEITFKAQTKEILETALFVTDNHLQVILLRQSSSGRKALLDLID